MKKILKQTVAILLAVTLCMGNNGLVQSPLTDTIKEQVSNETALTVKAATIKTSKVPVKMAGKKSTITAYNKKAKKAYQKFLKDVFVYGKYHHGWFANKTTREYAITDLNNDGKLELLLNTNPIYGNATGCILYTYYKGKVKEAGETYAYEINYLGFKKGNLIYNCVARMGFYEYYSILKNGKLVTVASYYDDEAWGGTTKYYEVKGKKVTKKKFSAFLKKSIGCKNGDDLRKNINKYEKSYKVQKYKMPTVKPVTGIKINHQFGYEKNEYSNNFYLSDKCKVTWSKSVKGNVQIVYSTDKKFKYKNTKTIKASSKKNSFTFSSDGSTYYVKLRAYIGDKVAKSKYSKVYTFKGIGYGNGFKKSNVMYYACVKSGKDYVCKRNLKTNKESKLFSSSKELRVVGVEGNYLYYTEGNKGNLYSYNMTTKQKTFMLNLVWDHVEIAFGKVFCQQDYYLMDYENADLYTFDLDGTNKKKVLEDIITYFTYNNQIYWCNAEFTGDGGVYYILRRCDLNGENKIDVTDWIYTENIEEIYISKEYAIEHYIND